MSMNMDHQVIFLILLLLGGHIGMLLILSAVFLSRHVKRHAVFINFCLTWMLYTWAYTLLFYTGHVSDPRPNFRLCIVQGAMVYGSPAMAGFSVLAFITHLYLMLQDSVSMVTPRWPTLRLSVMLVAPYVVFILVFIVSIILASTQPERVRRTTFYCTIEMRKVTYTSAGTSAAAVMSSLVIELLIAITLHRHWRDFRVANTKIGLSVSVLIRTLVMLIVGVVALLTCFGFLAGMRSNSMAPHFVLASLPLATFLVFGTQADLIRAWCFWRRDHGAKYTEDT